MDSSRDFQDLLVQHPFVYPRNHSGGMTILSMVPEELPSLESPQSLSDQPRGEPLTPITTLPGNTGNSPPGDITLTTIGTNAGPPPPQYIQLGAFTGYQPPPPHLSVESLLPLYPPFQTTNGDCNGGQKRKSSTESMFSTKSGIAHVKQEPVMAGPSYSEISPTESNSSTVYTGSGRNRQDNGEFGFEYSFSNDPSGSIDSSNQCIKFRAFQEQTWHALTDADFMDIDLPYYHVDADKGFNFSCTDDAFLCQKKNHFQVTCHVKLQGDPKYVKTPEGLKLIDGFYVHFFGVKMESVNQIIKIEQSQSDRSKKPFHPILVDMSSGQIATVTAGRLHFSETTTNNMRKKGKPNPDQRYFYLVVALQAHCNDIVYPIIAHASQRIIVRASNPGQFESDVELPWQKGQTNGSVYHAGRVGINTDRPDEALVVFGNCRITGQITHPSDSRVKRDIREVDSEEQLRNVQQLRVVRYKYNPKFARLMGLSEEESVNTGVLAQEVQKVIPDAVKVSGDVEFGDGNKIENLLVVNKERIFMENIGAVKELCKVTGNLENRIGQLEQLTMKRSGSRKDGSESPSRSSRRSTNTGTTQNEFICSNKCVQFWIFVLALVTAFCLIAMASLYILEYQRRSSTEILNNTPNFAVNSTHRSMTSLDGVTHNIPHDTHFEHESQNNVAQSSRHESVPLDSDPFALSLAIASKVFEVSTKSSKTFFKAQQWNYVKYELNPEPLPRLKPAVLGRPLHCPLHLTSSPCKVFCCAGGNLDETDNESVEWKNYISWTSVAGISPTTTTSTDQNKHTTDRSSTVARIPVQDNGLEYKRRRRQTQDGPRLLNLPSVHIRSQNINQRLGPAYCMENSEGYHDCVSTGNRYFENANLAYHVPLSKYWDETNISIIFNVSSNFDISEPRICEKLYAQPGCPLITDGSDKNKVDTEHEPSSPVFRILDRNVYSVKLDVGTHPYTLITIRFSPNPEDHENVCTLNFSSSKFFILNFYFYRVCDE